MISKLSSLSELSPGHFVSNHRIGDTEISQEIIEFVLDGMGIHGIKPSLGDTVAGTIHEEMRRVVEDNFNEAEQTKLL